MSNKPLDLFARTFGPLDDDGGQILAMVKVLEGDICLRLTRMFDSGSGLQEKHVFINYMRDYDVSFDMALEAVVIGLERLTYEKANELYSEVVNQHVATETTRKAIEQARINSSSTGF